MTKRVLVVDDDPGTRQLLAAVMTDLGAEVVEASTDEEGYRCFLELGADLALIDVLLPSQGGVALLRRIRAVRGGKSLPVFMMSALFRGANIRAESVGELGALDFFKKPFQLGALRERITQVLDDVQDPESDEALPFAPGSGVDRGSFAAIDPPVVIRDLLVQNATGCLNLRQGRTKKVLFLREGAVVFALSNKLGETLGRALLARGTISDDAYRSGLEAMRSGGKKMGEHLVAEGVLDPRTAADAIRENVLAKVLEVFSWREGEFQLAPFRPPPVPVPGSPLELTRVLFQGVCERSPYERIGSALAAHGSRTLSSRGDLFALAGAVPLEKEDLQFLRLLGRLRGKPLGEVLRGVGGEREVRFLYYLLLCGHLGLTDGSHSGGTDLPPADRERVQRARRRLASLRDRNHFQVLEVSLTASDEKVREAYLRRARDVHPDILGPLDPDELRRLYGELFQAVQGAYEALKTEALRQDYLAFLQEGLGQEATDGARILEAETLFQEGRVLLVRRQWEEAAAALRKALDIVPEEGEYALHLGVARTRQAASGKTEFLVDAEELFLQARAALPSSPEPCYQLGRLALLRREVDAATEHFNAALARDPRHTDALRELRLLKTRENKGRSVLEGLLGKRE